MADEILLLDHSNVQISRKCVEYGLKVVIGLTHGKPQTECSYFGNIPPSVLSSLKHPDIWPVSDGFCVKFVFGWFHICCSDGVIVSCEKIPAYERESYKPKPRRRTYINVQALTSKL